MCAVENRFHGLLGCGLPGLALLAGMSPESTMEKVIPPTACRTGHGLSSERGDFGLGPLVLLVTQ